MVKGCCVHGCTANSSSNSDRNFFIIPKESNRRERWLRAINRAHVNEDGSVDQNKLWAPTSGHNYVCSAHFVSGKKVNDPCHPDFVPSVFPQNEDSAFSKSSKKVERYKRTLKRHIAETESGGQKVTARKKLKLLDQQSPEYHKRTLSEHSYVKNLQIDIDEHSGEVNCDESCDYYPNSVSVQTDILPIRQPLEESER
ncbi:THAP domain-containing protein 11-like [Ostrea edulis]|uniref:THAP domain-containing protein 11-like n=1 Tax=Ostrea edulis TaxID=37623 RepID=UPI0024AF8CC9|nr:THAP domain-containing protein 11-like [Ostrea edulis]